MKKTFLDYYKEILEKVSFDPYLFKKEFAKALKTIEEEEVCNLIEWLESRGFQSDFIPAKTHNRSL
jgi:hypothetical protein